MPTSFNNLYSDSDLPNMTITDSTKTPLLGKQEDQEKLSNECKDLLSTLPKHKGCRTPHLYLFQGFWCQPAEIQAILSFQNHFQANDSDVIIATIPKSGTTWLKALCFAVVNRHRFSVFSEKNHPLHASNPHDLVPFFEYKLYGNNQIPQFSDDHHHVDTQPRLFGTHVPYHALAISIKKCNSKIVYICRNPFDTFVSSWHYVNKIKPQNMPSIALEEAFDMYCKGVVGFGPYWDHMLGYQKESIDRPGKVLFLKYEDMKDDIVFELRKVANFLGCPFTSWEERNGVVERIAKLCSFENLKKLEVNKSGKSIKNFENKNLFRKGEVGDWVNYLTPNMVERLSKIIEDKLGGSGLMFQFFFKDQSIDD